MNAILGLEIVSKIILAWNVEDSFCYTLNNRVCIEKIKYPNRAVTQKEYKLHNNCKVSVPISSSVEH